MTANIFKNDAKSIIDTLFETGYFNDGVTRDNMNAIEDLVDYLLSSRFESYKRVEKLSIEISAKRNKTEEK